MSDDWRVTVTAAAGHRERFLGGLPQHELDAEMRTGLAGGVVVSNGGDGEVYLYADNARQAHAAADAARSVVSKAGVAAAVSIDRWHPGQEEWQPESVPMPKTSSDRAAEHHQLMSEETAESVQSGVADWEVRVRLRSHHEATAFAEQLTAQGEAVVRRWRFLVVGAANEDAARELKRKVDAEAPAGAQSDIEPGGGIGWQDGMPGTPFSIFADLGA